jgi:hypothetical protein
VIKAKEDLPGTEGGRGKRLRRGTGGRNDPKNVHVNKRIILKIYYFKKL